MNRTFLSNLILLISINLLIKPFYIFGIDRTVQNRVGLEDYGLYATLFSFTFLFQIINDFGIQSFNNRNIAQYPHLLPKYFPNLLILKVGLGVVYSLFTVGVAYLLGFGEKHYSILLFFIFNQILISAIFFFRSNISGLGYYRVDSLVTILDRSLLIFICSILLWTNLVTGPFQIEWFVYAQSVSLLVTAAIAFLFIYRKLPSFKCQFHAAFLVLMLKKSYPYALAIFLMTLYTRIDFVMIERLLGDGEREAGIYASAYRLLDAVNVLGLLFSGLLLPMSARLLKEKQSIRPILRLSLKLILCIAIITSFSVFFFRNDIMFLLYEDTSFYAANILGILMFTFIFTSGIYVYGTILTANNSLKTLNKIFTVSVLLNIVLNFLFIPKYGALGAAGVTFFTQGFAFICQILTAKKIFRLSIDLKLLGQFLLLGITLSGLSLMFIKFALFDWISNFFMVVLLGVGASFLLNLLKVSDFLNLLRTTEGRNK